MIQPSASVRTALDTIYPDSAIILYRSSHRGPIRFALEHPIQDGQNGIELGAGVPLSMESIAKAMYDLAEENGVGSGYLPEYVLARSPSQLSWWCPPGNRTLFVRGKDEKQRSFSVSHPGLVFKATPGDLFALAIKGNTRPGPDAECFESPFFNVWKGGRMCQGNVEYPDGTLIERIKSWESSFFDSLFTHSNAFDAVNYNGGLVGLWNDLVTGVIDTIPEKVLVPVLKKDGSPLTVASFVD